MIKILRNKNNPLIFALLLLLLNACGARHPEIPSNAVATKDNVRIMPDYSGTVIPPNIAPLNFQVADTTIEECVAQIAYPGGTMTFGEGRNIIIDEDSWQTILSSSRGKLMQLTLYAKKDGVWKKHPQFSISVADEPIDPYISYRLIPPSYTLYERLAICQRNIANFEETTIYNNQMLDVVKGGQCINCHSYQNYSTQRMQFHVRGEYGGTVIYDNGNIKKVNLKRENTISAGVYPAWHPQMNVIAYSMNKTMQHFHTIYKGKVEVQDSEAGMMLYDVETDRVLTICNNADELCAFPTWSPDGKYLYYSCAHFEYKDTVLANMVDEEGKAKKMEAVQRYKEIKYDIVRRRFNSQNLTFGEAEMVWNASASGKSATVPRISPDGRYLLVSLGNYGCFHIWHPESDLYVMELGEAQTPLALTAANSKRADSFHNWSSNGRWILFASRRRDGNYSRLYISYFDKNGVAHKAFELPQKDPEYEDVNLCSYNVPEFMKEPVKASPQDFAKCVFESVDNK